MKHRGIWKMIQTNGSLKKIVALAALLLAGALIYSFFMGINSDIKAVGEKDGLFDISGKSFETGKFYSLGDWERVGGMQESSDPGTGTYRVRIASDERETFGMLLSDFCPAYRIWINGRLAAENGVLPDEAGDFSPSYSHEILEIDRDMYFDDGDGFELEIVVEAIEAGEMGPDFGKILLGKASTLQTSVGVMIGLNLFAAGVFLTLFIFSIFLYMGGKREGYLLFFSLTSIVSFVKSLVNSNPVLAATVLDMDYVLIERLDFSTAVLNTLLLLLLYDAVYPGYMKKGLIRGLEAASLLFVAGAFAMGYDFIKGIAWPAVMLIFTPTFLLCAYINARAVLDGGMKAIMLFAGFTMYSAGAVFTLAGVFGTAPLGIISMHVNAAQYGAMGFFILFSVVIADIYGKSFKETGILSERLADANENLETAIAEKTCELRNLNEKLRVQAETDGLTGLLNHNAIIKRLKGELLRNSRYGGGLSVLMVDVDHFRRINSKYGHLEGDRVLSGIGRVMTSSLRHIDAVGRYGGEEFLIVLPETPFDEAVKTAERIRRRVEEMDIGLKNDGVTISIGVAGYESGQSEIELIDKADSRLYESKRAGRNKVS